MQRLPFAARLLITATIALMVAGFVMVAVAARQEARDSQQELALILDQELETLPATLAEVVVVGDFSTLNQTLERYVSRPLVIAARYIDSRGAELESRDPVKPNAAPRWFLAFFHYEEISGEAPVIVGGREYGRLGLTLSPLFPAHRAWLRLLQHMAILLLAVAVDFAGIWLVLRFGLRPLQRLESGAEALAAGRLDTRLPPEGAPEMRRLITAFNRMAESIQTAQAEVRESSERLRLAIKGANDGIWDWDLRTNAVYFSPRWKQMIGYAEDELENRFETFEEHLHPDDLPRVRRTLETYLAGKRSSYAVEFRFRHKDGSWRWVLARGEALRDGDGRPYRMAGSHTDITARKEDEAELLQYQDHLEDLVGMRTEEMHQALRTAEAANRAKSQFLANMSHELRTPLNSILGFAKIMDRDNRLDATHHRQLETIHRSGQHLLALINDVLEISRIEAGRARVESAPFDLPETITSIEEMIRIRADAKKLHLTVEIQGELPRYCLGDAHHLRQVLINLLGNAVKFTDRGGITLTVTPLPGAVRFEVADTGLGIAAEEQERVFQAFYQTDDGAARGEGTGLGLTISREFVHLMGGELTVSSLPGQGTRFAFAIPLAPTTVPSASSGQGRVIGLEPGQRPFRILVAEDKADNRVLAVTLLREVGFDVAEAENGREAVEMFQSWQPDMIWMDMRMPIMNGYEATRAIRALPGGDSVKIGALTASAFQEDRDAILAAGCDEMVRKPIEDNRLFAVMASLLKVRFVYVNPPALEGEAASPENLACEMAKLPADLRDRLFNSATLLDMEGALRVVEQMREAHTPLAQALEELIQDFRFDRILELCEGCSS